MSKLGVVACGLALGAGAVVGCSNGTCPEGFHSNGTFCEPDGQDAGPLGAIDAGTLDAGPLEDVFVVPVDAPIVPDAWAPDAFSPIDACTPATLYVDADGDGFGDPATARDACVGAPGLVADATDCDDLRAETHPGATEVCNAIDDDCDTLVDDGVLSTFYADGDGDGHGLASSTTEACAAPTGYVASSDDCNDGCATCYPGATEVCDGLDNDCDTLVDDGVLTTFYLDADGDTYGTSATTEACTLPAGYATRGGDCNDGCMTCNPGASEVCDGLDNDCDALIDDGVLSTFYRDADGDTYGLTTMTMAACTAPAGYVGRGGDCNDACMTCNPGASEVCDGLDNDCDAMVDDGVLTRFYLDCDGDGYTLAAPTTADACSAPVRPAMCTGSTVWLTARSATSDCADQDSRAFPGTTMYQPTAIIGPRTVAAYDFNCDGVQTREFTTIALCLDATIVGWASATAPACGGAAFWDDCIPPNDSRTQTCR
ncbi:MAG: hypothetical protein K1X94_17420 [Sandaracinaceae bacterium]|nr:hypothetical protein [Sandaracinaceae bacterium]